MPDIITINTHPSDLAQRMGRYPDKLHGVMKVTMDASLLHVQGSIPGYAIAPPDVDDSQRTGTMGRTLGVAQSGGVLGKAQIHTVRSLGSSAWEGTLGTKLDYPAFVIGTGTQGSPWSRYWWTMETVARRATSGVINLHLAAVNKMLAWLDGKSIG